MNKQAMTGTPALRSGKNFHRALLLALLACAWPLTAARGHVPQARLQKSEVQTAKPEYVCPMHPEVKSRKRGKCPKCGMALRLASSDKGAASAVNVDASLDGHGGTAESATTASQPPATLDPDRISTIKVNIPDIEVVDQEGKKVHFYSDLIKGKTVAINFIFTTCTTICPPLAATFARVQREMGDRVGRDAHFISISVDPVTDTPERLKAWGAKFRAGAGWTFVTGGKEEIDNLLNALGASVGRREDHSPTVIIGNDLTGEWTRAYGLAKPSQLVALIHKVTEGKRAESLVKESPQR
ncbi:MAG: SCO family protein [Acidobacteriota bacterium]